MRLYSGNTKQLLFPIGTIPCLYCLTAEKVEKFPIWFDDIYPKLYAQNRSDNFKAMMRAYDRSYLIGITESEYIMLFSILEMIFGSGNSEITYQISRGTALLLSNNADDMLIIYKQMKKLYTARSKYVHSGIKISLENLYNLREIVRKVLIRLVQLGYHTKDKTFIELRDKIMLGGYHSLIDEDKEI